METNTSISVLPLDIPSRREREGEPASIGFLQARWAMTATLLRAALEATADEQATAERETQAIL